MTVAGGGSGVATGGVALADAAGVAVDSVRAPEIGVASGFAAGAGVEVGAGIVALGIARGVGPPVSRSVFDAQAIATNPTSPANITSQ